MTILDKKIRVEFNSHGGIVFHIPAMKCKEGFAIWSTIGGKWSVTKADKLLQDFDTPVEALWRGMEWGDNITIDDAILDEVEPV